MAKTPTISEIFTGTHKHARLCGDIFRWYIIQKKSNAPTSFRFTDIGNWLVKNHLPYVEYYNTPPESSTPYGKRVENRRDSIEATINELIILGLVEISSYIEAEKNKEEETPLYDFTLKGKAFAWIMDTKDSEKGNNSITAYEMIFKELSSSVKGYSGYLGDCFSNYFDRCVETALHDRIEGDPIEFLERLLPTPDDHSISLRKSLLRGLYFNDESSRIFREVIDSLEPLSKKLTLFQIKMDVEMAYYDESGPIIEWEVMRYQNITDETKLVIQGICLECMSKFMFVMDISYFLDRGMKFSKHIPNSGLFIPAKLHYCEFCENNNCRALIPVWYTRDEFINAIPKMEKIYDKLPKDDEFEIDSELLHEKRFQVNEFIANYCSDQINYSAD